MKFALIWSREVESRALAILGPSLTRKERKGRAFPICYCVYVITNASSRRGIIAIVVEYARRRPIQGDLYAVFRSDGLRFKACTLALGTDI
jgi:hypothetical protein